MESTELSLPPELPYPIIISSLHLHPTAQISRGVRLLTYSYTHISSSDGSSETRFGTWDSPIEGTVDAWKINQGDIISQKRATEAVVLVNEPCKHGMQVGGLCGLCGKDMTDFDYTGFSNASRASIQMTHSARGPTVSLEEAQRFERETAAYLLKSRKLSLIVDLDQTIVHATVDPTVGEWIAEGEAWDAKRSKAADDGETLDDEKAVNPNWEALRDVKKFRLGAESLAPQSPLRGYKGKERFDVEGCMYYIKPRPGLSDFLHRLRTKYEMHVYTMGTRAYAEGVCAVLDPDGAIFGGRILSRDESGSLTQKSLQRLFPCDTSMVVIIDDRADVWEWSPNLLKVRPYDFFVGIGDINSTFLPNAPSLVSTSSSVPSRSDSQDIPPVSGAEAGSPATQPDDVDVDATFASQNQLTIERIAAQVEERPLAKKQEALLEDSVKTKDSGTENNEEVAVNGLGDSNPERKALSPQSKALLKNDDTELVRVEALLDDVHAQFYNAYDASLSDKLSPKQNGNISHGNASGASALYDVKLIIPRIRTETFSGVHILFSSVIPLDVDPPSSEIWRTAEVFGAKCHLSLSDRVTHVVAAKRGTAKVDAARRRGGIHIVWLAWFLESLANWKRQPETPYLIDAEVQALSTTTPLSTSLGHSFEGPSGGDVPEEDLLAGGELITPDADIWADANAEVDAFLEEDDDSQVETDDDGWRTDESRRSKGVRSISTPKGKKRSRSSSITESGASASESRHRTGDENTRSPLAKRKKLSAARSGSSRLKVGALAKEIYPGVADDRPAEESDGDAIQDGNPDGDGGDGDAGNFHGDRPDREGHARSDQESSTDDNELDDDDFLAREMTEELG